MDGHRKADIKLADLLVNPENYRFDPVANQQEAMLAMLRAQRDKILNLARDIAQRGLNPMERLVVKEIGDGKYIVLEGNRRIIALKLMANPGELSDGYPYKGVFEELHDKYKDILPTAVECVIYRADQQDSADSWIHLKHTGENQGVGTVPWNTVQRQRFASRHAEQEPKTLQILEFLKENGIDTTGVLATNLERLLTTPQVRQALGFDFVNKQLALLEPEADVIAKLKKVVGRMSAKGFSVKDIYHMPDRLRWIQDVLGLQPASVTPPPAPTPPPAASNGNGASPAPQPMPATALSGGNSAAQPVTASTGTSTAAPPQPVSPPLPPALAAPSVYYTLVSPTRVLPATIPTKIVKIYKELQIVHVTGQRQAPHAVAAHPD